VLDKRIGQWFSLRKEIQKLGFNAIPFICGDGQTLDNDIYNYVDKVTLPPIYPNSIQYLTWYNRPAPFNAWQCHKQMLNNFINNFDDGYLWLLEDDAKIEEDFHEILIKCEDDINIAMPDMLYLGAYHREGSWKPTGNNNLLKLDGSGGWHSVIISHKVAQMLSKCLPTGPFDWISADLHKHLNCMAVYPSIVSQSDGISFIEGHHLSKPSRYDR